MKIGIISDTHGYLDPQVKHYFTECDEIWHAGDIGSLDVAEQLASMTRLRAVYGNIDGEPLCKKYPKDIYFTCEGVSVWITHIAGRPGAYPAHIKKKLQEKRPDILVCGHTHILRVIRDLSYHNFLYFNPGAAGRYGIHAVRTILRLEIKNKKPCNMEVIELGGNIYHR